MRTQARPKATKILSYDIHCACAHFAHPLTKIHSNSRLDVSSNVCVGYLSLELIVLVQIDPFAIGLVLRDCLHHVVARRIDAIVQIAAPERNL